MQGAKPLNPVGFINRNQALGMNRKIGRTPDIKNAARRGEKHIGLDVATKGYTL